LPPSWACPGLTSIPPSDGYPDKEIATMLFISNRTVNSHVAAIVGKLGVDSRTAAVARAIRLGLV
jgi:DNA-binding NarL/FixJ family response regulator